MAEGNADGLVVEHCLSRTVRDSAALLDVTQGPRPGDRWWRPPPKRPYLDEVAQDPDRLTIGFTTADFLGRPAHPDCVAAVEDAARLCEALGHRVEEACPAVDGEQFDRAFALSWAMKLTTPYKSFLTGAAGCVSHGMLLLPGPGHRDCFSTLSTGLSWPGCT